MGFIVYQLKLVEDKHYFGTTAFWRKDKRMEEHYQGVGAKWTSRFAPVDDPVVEVWHFNTRDEAYAFENVKCEEFLNKYGIDSTRGGLQNYGNVGNYKWWCRPHLRHLCPSEYKFK